MSTTFLLPRLSRGRKKSEPSQNGWLFLFQGRAFAENSLGIFQPDAVKRTDSDCGNDASLCEIAKVSVFTIQALRQLRKPHVFRRFSFWFSLHFTVSSFTPK
jgi:hypothetical protein